MEQQVGIKFCFKLTKTATETKEMLKTAYKNEELSCSTTKCNTATENFCMQKTCAEPTMKFLHMKLKNQTTNK
jgi:hypothetical protein